MSINSEDFSLFTFQTHSREGRLEEIVHEFLRGPGRNLGLSDGLKKRKRFWVGPIELENGRLHRCCGPEESMEYRVDRKDFEARVDRIVNGIRSGWEMPPLIAEYRDGRFSVRDGNHRFEALERLGIRKSWAIVWFNSLQELAEAARFGAGTFFVTGTSGAGKTTLVETMRSWTADFLKIHDFDEDGVPPGADEHWRRGRTETLLRKAEINRAEGKTTLVCGVSVPKEIQQAPSFSRELNIRYGLIKIGEDEIRRRLGLREWPGSLIDDNVEWAKHLERFVKAEKDGRIIDGSNRTPAQVAEAVLDWMIRETCRL